MFVLKFDILIKKNRCIIYAAKIFYHIYVYGEFDVCHDYDVEQKKKSKLCADIYIGI